MKKIVYLNLSDSAENHLADLKLRLQELSKDKVLGWFLSMELIKRRDTILFDEKLSSEFKAGALSQLIELTDMLFGSGVVEIQKILMKKNKIEIPKVEEDFKNKVLKL